MPFRSVRAGGWTLLVIVCAMLFRGDAAYGHPLGNFTINHFARIETDADRARIRYVVDYAEIPAFQEAQRLDADSDGASTREELNAWLDRAAPEYLKGLKLLVEGTPVALRLEGKSIELLPGAAGLATMRIVLDLTGAFAPASAAPRFQFENANLPDRAGWREIVLTPGKGVNVFDSTAYGSGVTDELRAYPEDLLAAPLDERRAEWSVTRGGVPAGAKSLTMRDGRPIVAARDRFAELIAAPSLTPGVMLIGLLAALALGAAHALSPGHGKAIVGAWLVGSRGTARHAAFLGVTVTITHTVGVFALGLVTLVASRYILPEKLYPILSFLSGAIVVVIGGSLFARRVQALFGVNPRAHSHGVHDHGPGGHSHLPPEIEGAPLSWRNLLALGISGGILPCPSALVVMLGAISINRVGYGLALIVAFSLGLAAVLTAIGLAFVYAGRAMELLPRAGALLRAIPVLSALVITALGAIICYQALGQAGIDLSAMWNQNLEASAIGILTLGLVIGLQHALDTDHLAAVSTIVSERRNLFGSLLIGGVWGVGHTIALLVAGIGVILLQVQIEKYEKPLEFCVALMLIGLGANVLYKLSRGGKIHFHEHAHGERIHVHPHLHGVEPEPERSHHGLKLGVRPLIIGLIHGLAGSAALMLAVLARIESIPLQFAYIGIFGVGSIGGMMLMSLLLSLPIHFTASHFTRTNLAMRALAGVFSLGFGLFMAYEIGYVDGLFR
ncbi:MAG: nickel/cobalt transporter [Blastocatellia bacterium]